MAIAIIAAIGVAVAAAGAGYSASGAGQPTQPNLGASSREMSNTEAELLPVLRQLQAAAEEGKTAILPGYKQTTESALQQEKLGKQLDTLKRQFAEDTAAAKTNPTAARGLPSLKAKIAGLQTQYDAIPSGGGTVYTDKNGRIVPASKAVADFAGYSQADTQGKITTEEAQNQLAESQKYDSQFIDAALAQEKLADPQSFEARAKMYDLIQQQINNPPDSPVADELEKQTQAKVGAGSGLTPDEQKLLASAIASGAGDRGGDTGGADFSDALTTGFAGEQRALANANAGAQFLASGQTPEDIKYRAEQQDLANLSNYMSGQTPTSQFRELSGAQQGPTPNTTGGAPALPTMPGNAGSMGAGAAVQGYQAAVQGALGKPNPWMSGLSGILGASNIAASAGWQPLAAAP